MKDNVILFTKKGFVKDPTSVPMHIFEPEFLEANYLILYKENIRIGGKETTRESYLS